VFPLGIATGRAFCNRRVERERLGAALLAGRHTWLMAPRRYGKTSLIHQVLLDLGRDGPAIDSEQVDLLLAHDLRSVRDLVLAAVGRLTARILPSPTRALRSLGRFFGGLRPEFVIDTSGARVRFNPGGERSEQLSEALAGLDAVARSRGVRAVLVVDEFQQVAGLHEGIALEGAIRHAAQGAQAVSYVFSGSHRRMLSRMFEDASRPLYHLCERLNVERIKASEYRSYLKSAARRQWHAQPSAAAVERILDLSACHPYYVNVLCGRLWREPRVPGAARVAAVWRAYVAEEAARIGSELVSLSPNQRAVLAAIAAEPTAEPRGRAFLERTRVASTSVGQALAVLLERDLAFRDPESRYRVLDPAMEWSLREGLRALR